LQDGNMEFQGSFSYLGNRGDVSGLRAWRGDFVKTVLRWGAILIMSVVGKRSAHQLSVRGADVSR